MKDVHGTFDYKGNTYKLVFNLNVMEIIQEEYESVERWGDITAEGEGNAKAIKFGFAAMILLGSLVLMLPVSTRSGEGVIAWLKMLGIEFIYALGTPIEIPLSEEEIAAFGDLRTYRGHTTISNSGHAHMELEYVMDAKKYIDSLIGTGGSSSGTILPATVE